jgi:hypothetical protein
MQTAALPLFTTILAFEMTNFNAPAVTHVLSTAGEITIASKRIQLSWF